ncbi:MAG TPA: response regulator [Steroidobacteraceae bacterium]|nr:response regulator [Steroidobacteraceae bacterium]
MHNTATSSWTQFIREPRAGVGFRASSAHVLPMPPLEAQQLDSWESEGGRSLLSTESMRILIVDNDVCSSESVQLMLHASDYWDTRVVYSGRAALAMAEEFQPSVVLLELKLMDMSGYEVGRLLRERAQSREFRLIALTSSREHAGRELARESGFERYLLKPVAAPDLLGLLQKHRGYDA